VAKRNIGLHSAQGMHAGKISDRPGHSPGRALAIADGRFAIAVASRPGCPTEVSAGFGGTDRRGTIGDHERRQA